MKKKILLICVAAAAVAALAVGGTLAYLTATDEATNTFAIGNVKGELTENGKLSEEDVLGEEKDNIFVDWDNDKSAANIAPGQTVQKAPVVKNTGANAAYVRLTLGVGFENFTLIGLATDWIYDGEKYYYNEVLAPGESTSALFTGVKLDTDYAGGNLDIMVYAELIQANYLDNLPEEVTSSGTAAIDAFYWFDNPPTASGGGESGGEGEEGEGEGEE